MISFSMVMQFLGGLGLFLYGIATTSEGLQKIAAGKLKQILQSFTRKPWSATLFGIVMTVALQSSSATTAMVVEFVNSGLMTLSQALGVALGSTIGTSIVIQIIALPILDIALFLIFCGFIFFLMLRTQLTKLIGQALIGFGCIFIGMTFLTGAFAPLKNSPEVYDFLSKFGANPFLGVFIGIILTTLIQSSAAYLAILISLSAQGLLGIEAIVPLVMGTHIGGTVTTLISSFGAERIDAKRVAVANSFYRIAATLILLPFFPYFENLILWSTNDLPRQVANTHLFSGILTVIIFLPLNGLVAKALTKVLPGKKGQEPELKSKYITRGALEVPAVALQQAWQEIRWLGYNILDNMLQLLPRALETAEDKWVQELENAERKVDWHYGQLQNFLRELFQRNMTREQIVENHSFRLISKELESIADCLVVMARLRQKNQAAKIGANPWLLLEDLYQKVSGNYLALLRFFDRREPHVAQEILEAHSGIIEAYNSLQGNSCDDQSDQKEVLAQSSWFYKIGEHIASIAKVLA